MPDKLPLTVVVITKNEESRIRECLESVRWADEIIVVDDNSTDNTVKIAQEFTDRVFEKKMDIEGKHRNWGYAQSRNNWVLSLDADERVTPELKEEIRGVIAAPGEYNGFAIPRRNYIGDYWIRFGGWYPSAQLKLFKKGSFKWEEAEVHPRAFLDGGWKTLERDIIHYSYRDFADYVAKLNSQTTLEATKWVRSGRQMSLGRALWRTFDRFMRSYLRKKAYKDGFVGFMISILGGFYQILSYAKYKEMKGRKR